MASSSTHLVKLNTDSAPLYAIATWNDAGTSLDSVILQKDKAWQLTLGQDDMAGVAKKLQVDKEEAMQWLKDAFSSDAEGEASKAHHFAIYDGESFLVWKKSTKGSRMKARVGTFPMKEAPDAEEARMAFMDAAVAASAGGGGSAAKNEEQEQEIERLKDLARQYEERMAKMAADKDALETAMYEQFLPILKSKQEKIRSMARGEARPAAASAAAVKDEEDDSYGSATDVDEKMDE